MFLYGQKVPLSIALPDEGLYSDYMVVPLEEVQQNLKDHGFIISI